MGVENPWYLMKILANALAFSNKGKVMEKKELKEKPVTVHITNHNQFQKGVGAFITNLNHLTIVMDSEGNMKMDAAQMPIMPHTEVNEEIATEEKEQEDEIIPEGEELCKFIHPAIDKVRARKVHLVLKRLASSQDIQDICQYLNKMAKEELILQPVNPTTAYEELTRMGMPNTDGYSYKTFQKYYRK